MLAEPPVKKLTMTDIAAKGSLIAILISVPTLVVFFAIWTISDDLIYGAVGGLITNFITLGTVSYTHLTLPTIYSV